MKKIGFILFLILSLLLGMISCAPAEPEDIGSSLGSADIGGGKEIGTEAADKEDVLLTADFTQAQAEASSYVVSDGNENKRRAIETDYINKVIAKEDASCRTTYFRDGKLIEYTDLIADKDGFTFNVYKVGASKTEQTKSLKFGCFKEVKVYTLSDGAETYRRFYMVTKDKDTGYDDWRDFNNRAFSSSEDISAEIPCLVIYSEDIPLTDDDRRLVASSQTKDNALTPYGTDKGFIETVYER